MDNGWMENDRAVAELIKTQREDARKAKALTTLIQTYAPEWGDRAVAMGLGEKEGLVEAFVMQRQRERERLNSEVLQEQLAALREAAGERKELGRFWQEVGQQVAAGEDGLSAGQLERWGAGAREMTPGQAAMEGLGMESGGVGRAGAEEKPARGQGSGVGMKVLQAYLGAMKKHPSGAAAKELPDLLRWATAGEGKTGQWNLPPGQVIEFGGGVKGFSTGPNSMWVEKVGTAAGEVKSEDVPGMPGYKLVTKANGQTQLVKVEPQAPVMPFEAEEDNEKFVATVRKALQEGLITPEDAKVILARRVDQLRAMGKATSAFDELIAAFDEKKKKEKENDKESGGAQGFTESDIRAWKRRREQAEKGAAGK